MQDYAAAMDNSSQGDAPSALCPAEAAVASVTAPLEDDEPAQAVSDLKPREHDLDSWNLEEAPVAEWSCPDFQEPDGDERSESSLSASEPGTIKKHKGTCS